jgi:hypothetical protein
MDPQPVPHGFLYYNWGNSASVIGLFVSGFALFFARSASHAAREARDAARLGSLLDDIRRGEVYAKELSNHLTSHNVIKAGVRAEDTLEMLRLFSESVVIKSDVPEVLQQLAQSKVDIDGLSTLLQRLEQNQGTMNNRDLTKATQNWKIGIRDDSRR